MSPRIIRNSLAEVTFPPKIVIFPEPQTHHLHNVSVNSKQYNTKDLHKHKFKFGLIFAEMTPGL